MKTDIEDKVGRGKTTEGTNAVIYLEEQHIPDLRKKSLDPHVMPESNLGFTKLETPLEKVAMILPATQKLIDDKPAFDAYVNKLGMKMFDETLDRAAYDKIRERCRHVKVRWFERNNKVLFRTRYETEKAGRLVTTIKKITDKEAIVGAFGKGVTVWTQGEPRAEVSNANESFKKDRYAVKIEQRAAVTLFRPEAFTVVHMHSFPRLRKIRDKAHGWLQLRSARYGFRVWKAKNQ